MNPKKQGFYFPAEWEPHQCTWLSWPTNRHTWPQLEEMLIDYTQFVKTIALGEAVHINLNGSEQIQMAQDLLDRAGTDLNRIFFHQYPTNDAWCRDHGPSVLVNRSNSQRLILDWDYNSWGGKYPPFDSDQQIPHFVAKTLQIPSIKPGIILEGGSVDFNGQGTVLTTSHCLLNPNRNPHLNQVQIENYLCDYFGIEQVIWLGDGIIGDDTDGHVDDITRFVSPSKVVTVIENDKNDVNYIPLQENLRTLQGIHLANGHSLEIQTLPLPAPLIVAGERLPASYGNFYICNAGVIVPIFQDKNDEIALEIIQNLFPDRKVFALDSRKIVWGLGSFHCLSQQIPQAKQ